MTLEYMTRLANADAASGNARIMMAGKYAQKALRAISLRDWPGATQYAIYACSRSTNYAPLLTLIDAAKRGAATSEAKAAASRANGAKGGRPCTEFHEGKVFASEGGFRVCGGVWAGGPIIKQSPWFATREEAEREAAAMLKRRAKRDELDRLAGLRPEGL